MKRYRAPKAKENQLLVKYGKADGELDLFYCWPDNDGGMKADSRLLMMAIEENKIIDNKSLKELLIERGYDITTLKFTVEKCKTPPKRG